ncbi:MAG: hypothetical protein LC800_02625 [Acidobacteria bacterium]|nr:hypothetical protein [Acidobacteriota bacterium]
MLLFAWRFERLPLPPLAVSLLVLTPLCLAFAWLFFRLFERPFMSRRAARPLRDAATPAPVTAAALPAEAVAAVEALP